MESDNLPPGNPTPPSDDEREAIRALLPGYAMGITTPDENRLVAAALTEQPALRDELAEYRAIGAALLASVESVEPPPGALDALLEAASADAPSPRPSLRLWAKRSLLRPTWRVSPALVAAALVIVVGAVGYLAAQVVELRAEQESLRASLQYRDYTLETLGTQDVRWVKMQNPDEAIPSDPYAWLVYSPGTRAAVVLANHFPGLQPDQAYQLWGARDGETVSLGLFRVDDSGQATFVFHFPDDISAFTRVGITPEPAEGSPGPTAPPVVRIEF